MEEFEIEFKELDQFEIEDVREVVVQEVPTFPALENLIVTPTIEEQVFNHPNSYGYDEVRVEAVQGKSLEVTPSNEEQTFSDLYTNVKVQGDEDLQASNIKQGVEIFGVTGALEELTTETKEGINNQEEIITNQETTLEEINQVIQDKILVKEKYKPRVISFYGYTGTDLSEELDNLDISNMTSMQYMFNNCSNLVSLDLNNWNTSNITNMSYAFSGCSKLATLNISNFDTSNVTTFNSMFWNGIALTELDLSKWDTRNVTNMYGMFGYWRKLVSLNLSGCDASKVVSVNAMFSACDNLTTLKFMKNLGKGYTRKSSNYSEYRLTLSSSNKLDHDSLINVINNLYDLNLTYDVANGGTLYTQQLVLGSTNLAKLTTEEIAIATNKGWVVS